VQPWIAKPHESPITFQGPSQQSEMSIFTTTRRSNIKVQVILHDWESDDVDLGK
jgi:hypothetical protein